MSEKLFYSTKEVSIIANVNIKTVQRLIRKKEIPAVRVGKKYQIHKSYVDNLLKDWS